MKGTKSIRRQSFLPQTEGSAFVSDEVFEKEGNIQCKEGYCTVINGAVDTEDIVCSVYSMIYQTCKVKTLKNTENKWQIYNSGKSLTTTIPAT